MSLVGNEHLGGQSSQWQEELTGLATSAQAGDRMALDQLAVALVPQLEARARCKFYRTQDFQDLAHDAWCRIQMHLSDFDPSRPFWPWACTILDNLCKDALSKRKSLRWDGLSTDVDDERPLGQEMVDHSEAPGLLIERREAFFRVWTVLWESGGYPHQQLAFGYCKLLYGDQPGTKGRSAGAPTEVCMKHGHSDLDHLADRFFSDFLEAAEIPEGTGTANDVQTAMKPLFDRLGQLFGTLVAMLMPQDDCKRYGAVAQMRTGATSMSSYAEGGNLQSRHISDWSDKVRKRIARAILSEDGDDSASGSPVRT